MLVWQDLADVERRAVRNPVPALQPCASGAILRQPYRHFRAPHKQGRHRRQIRGDIMLRENRNGPLIEAIDNAIEEAEDRGLTFIASILMMARLEADQSILMTRARRVNDEHA
jgi:hypothetical protein